MYDNLDIYCRKIEHNNMIYSIDKLRLKTYISYSEFQELEFYIKAFHQDKVKNFWVSDRCNCFHYNYNLEVGENKSFLIQFMHNSESVNYNKDNKCYNFTIEFNPNKLKDDVLLMYILKSYENWLLRSFDLAIDIPINILDIVMDKSGKRKFFMQSFGGDDVTFYIGTKESDGSIKIYNKKKESNLHIVGDLTRVEIHRKYEDFEIMGIKTYDYGEQFFPTLYLNKYLMTFSDLEKKDKTVLGLLYAVQRGYSLNDLSRVYKQKVKSLLEGSSKIRFDRKSAGQAFRQCIFYYFVNTGSKQRFW